MTVSALHTAASVESALAGTSYAIQGLCRALGEAGAGVSLASLGEPSDQTVGRVRHRRFRESLAWAPGIRRLGLSETMRVAVSVSDAEILHGHGLWMMPALYAAARARELGHPFILSPHGMLDPSALQYSRTRKRLFWLLNQRLLSGVSCIHATAASELEAIRAFGLRQPVAIVPNGIDVPQDEVLERPEGRGRTVLSLGRLHPVKGLDQLIRAWALVEAERPDWRLDIVGPSAGAYAETLVNLVRRMNLRRVTIGPAVVGEEKIRRLSGAGVFVLPSLTENFAMTVAESLACGTPAIATKGAPWSQLESRRCGWWVDHGPEAIAAALREAMSVPDEERKVMGQRGRAWMIQEFSWNRVGAEMLAVYQWVLGRCEKPGAVHTA